MTLQKLWDRLLDLLYPPDANCLGCGSPLGADLHYLCHRCLSELIPLDQLDQRGGARCTRCGATLEGTGCARCAQWPNDGLAGARFVYRYRGPARRVLFAFKYHGVYRLSVWLGGEMAGYYRRAVSWQADVIVPVPLHPRRKRRRGYNQAELLAQEMARQLDLPVSNALRRTRFTRPQVRLERGQRAANLEGAFQAVQPLPGRRVLLVDDVVTTGATAQQCARALLASGADAVYLLALFSPE